MQKERKNRQVSEVKRKRKKGGEERIAYVFLQLFKFKREKIFKEHSRIRFNHHKHPIPYIYMS
jgi:hypothetical protein